MTLYYNPVFYSPVYYGTIPGLLARQPSALTSTPGSVRSAGDPASLCSPGSGCSPSSSDEGSLAPPAHLEPPLAVSAALRERLYLTQIISSLGHKNF